MTSMKTSQLKTLRAMGLTAWEQRSPAPKQQEVSELRTARETAAPQATGSESLADLSWSALAACVDECTRCDLSRTRQKTVFGYGDQNASWLFVGEGPGAEEDRRGLPFVGRAGKLLDAMLAAISLERTQVYITNIVKCRPPGNRDPSPSEASACRKFLDEQINRINPDLIIALGRIAAQRLLDVETSLGRLRGKTHRMASGHEVLVTYHPAYLLRNPVAKRAAWEDLQLALQVAAPRKPEAMP